MAFSQPSPLWRAQSLRCCQNTSISRQKHCLEAKTSGRKVRISPGSISLAWFGTEYIVLRLLITARRKGMFVLPPVWSQCLLYSLNKVILKPKQLKI